MEGKIVRRREEGKDDFNMSETKPINMLRMQDSLISLKKLSDQ